MPGQRTDEKRNRGSLGKRHEGDGDDRVRRIPRERRDDRERNEKAKPPGSGLLGKRHENQDD